MNHEAQLAIERLREQDDRDDQAWRVLVTAAADRELKARERTTLDGMLRTRPDRYSAQRFTDDVELVMRAAKLSAALAERQPLSETIARLRVENQAADARDLAAIAEAQGRINGRSHQLGMHERQLANLHAQDIELSGLQHEHWKLLGLEDPAVAARTRRIVGRLFDGSAEADGDVALEQLMDDPVRRRLLVDPTIQWHQETEEDRWHHARALELLHDGRAARYLVSDVTYSKIIAHRDVAILAAELGQLSPDNLRIELRRFLFIDHFGQAAGERDALLKRLRKYAGEDPKQPEYSGNEYDARIHADRSPWLHPSTEPVEAAAAS